MLSGLRLLLSSFVRGRGSWVCRGGECMNSGDFVGVFAYMACVWL